MELQGKVVKLRPIGVADAELTLGWRLGDRAKLMQRGATTVAQQREWIEGRLKTTEVNCIIEYRDRPVGMIALHDHNRCHNHVVMGRLLIGEEEFVGKAPVAFESELLLCDYAFDELKVHKIYGDVVEKNAAMLKLREYLGYRRDGVMRDHLCFDGEYINTHTFSLLEEEYRRSCRPKLQQFVEVLSSYS